MCDQQSLRSACTFTQSYQSICLSFVYSMSVKLLTEHYLEFLSLKECCTGSSESTLVKIPHCWKSHVATQNFCSLPDATLSLGLQSSLLIAVLVPQSAAAEGEIIEAAIYTTTVTCIFVPFQMQH